MIPLLLIALAAEPTAPPLVPQSESIDTQESAPGNSGKRLALTVAGGLVGGVAATAAVALSVAMTSALCGFECNANPGGLHPAYIIVALLAASGVGPLGAFFGNHLGGGTAPYWRPLIGTVFGLCGSSLLVVGFSKANLWNGVPGGIGVALSALLPVIAQVLATELGAGQDPP